MFVTRALRMSVQRSTGLVGIPYNENVLQDLKSLYNMQLDAVKAIPDGLQYRENVEKTAKYRIGLIDSGISREQVQEEIGGQVLEQLALYAEDELKLIPEYASWKLWEHPNFGKTVVFNDDYPEETPESK